MSKVLRSLAPKFDYVAMAIKESRDISKLSLYELSGSLQPHDIRVKQTSEKLSEKGLHMNYEYKGQRNLDCSDQLEFW